MGWASGYITKLLTGETVSFRPRGNSMQPKIKSGQLCTVEPLGDDIVVQCGDVVLCKVKGKEYLHLVRATRTEKGSGIKYQIGGVRSLNGWVGRRSIYGRCIRVES